MYIGPLCWFIGIMVIVSLSFWSWHILVLVIFTEFLINVDFMLLMKDFLICQLYFVLIWTGGHVPLVLNFHGIQMFFGVLLEFIQVGLYNWFNLVDVFISHSCYYSHVFLGCVLYSVGMTFGYFVYCCNMGFSNIIDLLDMVVGNFLVELQLLVQIIFGCNKNNIFIQ